MKTLKIPKGWTAETFEGLASPGEIPPQYTRAVDRDGCRWYQVDGEWRLNVPWFRRSFGLDPNADDDIAVVDTVDGNRPYQISKAGVIRIGRRRIDSRKWIH